QHRGAVEDRIFAFGISYADRLAHTPFSHIRHVLAVAALQTEGIGFKILIAGTHTRHRNLTISSGGLREGYCGSERCNQNRSFEKLIHNIHPSSFLLSEKGFHFDLCAEAYSNEKAGFVPFQPSQISNTKIRVKYFFIR